MADVIQDPYAGQQGYTAFTPEETTKFESLGGNQGGLSQFVGGRGVFTYDPSQGGIEGAAPGTGGGFGGLPQGGKLYWGPTQKVTDSGFMSGLKGAISDFAPGAAFIGSAALGAHGLNALVGPGTMGIPASAGALGGTGAGAGASTVPGTYTAPGYSIPAGANYGNVFSPQIASGSMAVEGGQAVPYSALGTAGQEAIAAGVPLSSALAGAPASAAGAFGAGAGGAGAPGGGAAPAGSQVTPTGAVQTPTAAGTAGGGAAAGTGAAGGGAAGAGTGGGIVDQILNQMKQNALGLGLIGASTLMANKSTPPGGQDLAKIESQIQQLGAPAAATGQQLLQQYNAGTLTPGQQASLDQLSQNTKNQLRQYFASIGQSNSSAAAQSEAMVDQQVAVMKQQMLDNALQNGLQAIGVASGPLQSVANMAVGQDASLRQAFGNFAGAIGNLFGRQAGTTTTQTPQPTQTVTSTQAPGAQ